MLQPCGAQAGAHHLAQPNEDRFGAFINRRGRQYGFESLKLVGQDGVRIHSQLGTEFPVAGPQGLHNGIAGAALAQGRDQVGEQNR